MLHVKSDSPEQMKQERKMNGHHSQEHNTIIVEGKKKKKRLEEKRYLVLSKTRTWKGSMSDLEKVRWTSSLNGWFFSACWFFRKRRVKEEEEGMKKEVVKKNEFEHINYFFFEATTFHLVLCQLSRW